MNILKWHTYSCVNNLWRDHYSIKYIRKSDISSIYSSSSYMYMEIWKKSPTITFIYILMLNYFVSKYLLDPIKRKHQVCSAVYNLLFLHVFIVDISFETVLDKLSNLFFQQRTMVQKLCGKKLVMRKLVEKSYKLFCFSITKQKMWVFVSKTKMISILENNL